LSLMKKEYMRGFKDTLMQLYDSRPQHRQLRTSQRKNAQTDFRVDDPYLNVLFATTEASFGANTEQNDTLSGFLARFLFYFPQGKKDRYLPLEEGTALISDFENLIYEQLSGIATKVGDLKECTALHLSPEANAYWANWQKEREEFWTASNDSSCMQIFSRLSPTIAKLVMLFELGSPDFDSARPIRLEFMVEACRLVDSYFMESAKAAYEIVGANTEKNIIDRIISFLKNHSGKATTKQIEAHMKIKSRDLNEYLNTMLEAEMIETKYVKTGKAGRPSSYVFLLFKNDNGDNFVNNVSKVDKIDKVYLVSETCSDSVEELATKYTKSSKTTKTTNSENCSEEEITTDKVTDRSVDGVSGKDRPTQQIEDKQHRFSGMCHDRGNKTFRSEYYQAFFP